MNYETDSSNCVENKMGKSVKFLSTVAAVLVSVMLMAPVAMADEVPDPETLFEQLTPEQERRVIELIDEGEEAYDSGNFEQATSRFHEVYEFFPHPNISYQLGLCYERLGNQEMAIQYYQRFLEQNPDAEERGRIERTIANLEDELGDDLSSVRVETFPIGADVYLGDRDTAPVAETPQSITLEPGSHDIFVEKPGYLPVETTVQIVEGQHDVVQFELEEDDSQPEGPERSVDRSGVSWWKPVVSVGLAGIGGLTAYQAVQYSGEAQRHQDTLDGMNSSDPDYGDVEHDRDQALRMSTTMGVTAGVALVGGGIFTAWWLLRDRRSGPMNVGVAPSRDGVNVGVYGRF